MLSRRGRFCVAVHQLAEADMMGNATLSTAVNVTGNALEQSAAAGRMGYVEGFNKGMAAAAGKFDVVVFMLFATMVLQVVCSRVMKMMAADDVAEGGTRYRVAYHLEQAAFGAQAMLIAFLFVMALGVPFFLSGGGL